MKLLLIEWVDSHSPTDRWIKLEDLDDSSEEPLYCRSVGWLFSETKECLTLLPTIGGEKNKVIADQAHGIMTIPKKAITSQKVLRVK